MEEINATNAMAKKLVEAMEPDQAKKILLAVVSGDELYEAILDDGKVAKPEKKKSPRKARADKGKPRSLDLPRPPVSPAI